MAANKAKIMLTLFLVLYSMTLKVVSRRMQNIEIFGPETAHCENWKSPPLPLLGLKIPNFQVHKDRANITEISSIRTLGVWALYSGPNYTVGTGISTISAPGALCHADLDDNYKSARYLGHSDMDLAGLSLFAGRPETKYSWPEGTETFVAEREASFNSIIQVAYWASTGRVSWTIYSRQNYTGSYSCLVGTDMGDSYAWGPLPFVSVGSVRQGCGVGVSGNHLLVQTASFVQGNDGKSIVTRIVT